MCVILACKDKKPSIEILEKCEKANPHGAGFMHFNDKGNVWYQKGLRVRELFELTEKIKLPFIIHFRWASSGGKLPVLTHPFEVSETSPLALRNDCKLALMHNGHFTDWRICLAAAGISEPTDSISDSRAIAMIISKNNLSFLEKITGHYIIADSSIGRHRMYGDFQEEDGIFYSNFSWKYGKTRCTGHKNDTQDSVSVPDMGEKKIKEPSNVIPITIIPAKSSPVTRALIKKMAIPVLDKNSLTGEGLYQKFREICSEGLSKKQQRRIWRRFCKINDLHSISFRWNIEDIDKSLREQLKGNDNKNNVSLCSESLQPDGKILNPVINTKIIV